MLPAAGLLLLALVFAEAGTVSTATFLLIAGLVVAAIILVPVLWDHWRSMSPLTQFPRLGPAGLSVRRHEVPASLEAAQLLDGLPTDQVAELITESVGIMRLDGGNVELLTLDAELVQTSPPASMARLVSVASPPAPFCQGPGGSPRWRPVVLPTGGQLVLPDDGQMTPRRGVGVFR